MSTRLYGPHFITEPMVLLIPRTPLFTEHPTLLLLDPSVPELGSYKSKEKKKMEHLKVPHREYTGHRSQWQA